MPKSEVADETPGVYKDIDVTSRAQKDLVEIEQFKQIVCVKG